MVAANRRAWVSGLSLTAALLLGAALPAQDVAPIPPRTIDLIAADGKGRQVENLTVTDFAVLQNGVARPIVSAHFVRDSARTIGLFLDEFHTPPGGGAESAREALLRLVRARLGPDDRIAVFKPLDSLGAIA